MIFHILNGDSLNSQFPEEIPGEKIIFRECLIDGPVQADSDHSFWEIRKIFIESEYPEAEYDSYSKDEILKINQIPKDSKVYFWFEEDLFCQVNFWKACTLLPKTINQVYLVLPGINSPYSFAHLTKDQLASQWRNALELDVHAIKLFEKLWSDFQNSEPENGLESISSYEGRFPFLKSAIKAWQQMIPDEKSEGLPMDELKRIHRELQTENFGNIFREFYKRLPIYGFGDMQVYRLWNKIKKGS